MGIFLTDALARLSPYREIFLKGFELLEIPGKRGRLEAATIKA